MMTSVLKKSLFFILIFLSCLGCYSCAALKTGSDPMHRSTVAEPSDSKDISQHLSQLENTQQQLKEELGSSKEQIDHLNRKISVLENQIQVLSGKPIESQPFVQSQKKLNDVEILYQQARNVLLEKNFPQAIELFQKLIDTYPENELADNAMYWMGECYYSMGNFNKAIGIFQELVSRYPKGIKVPDALLKTGYAYISLKDFNRANHFLKLVITQYPFSDAADKAQEKLDTFN